MDDDDLVQKIRNDTIKIEGKHNNESIKLTAYMKDAIRKNKSVLIDIIERKYGNKSEDEPDESDMEEEEASANIISQVNASVLNDTNLKQIGSGTIKDGVYREYLNRVNNKIYR